MTHPFEVRDEITVDATPDEVWEAIASGRDRLLADGAHRMMRSKTSTFSMFGEVSSSSITVWEPVTTTRRRGQEPGRHVHGLRVAHRVARRRRRGGARCAQWSPRRELGGRIQRPVRRRPRLHDKLAVYLKHFAPRTAKGSLSCRGRSPRLVGGHDGGGRRQRGRGDGQPAGSACPGSSRPAAPWSSWARRASWACVPTTRCTC